MTATNVRKVFGEMQESMQTTGFFQDLENRIRRGLADDIDRTEEDIKIWVQKVVHKEAMRLAMVPHTPSGRLITREEAEVTIDRRIQQRIVILNRPVNRDWIHSEIEKSECRTEDWLKRTVRPEFMKGGVLPEAEMHRLMTRAEARLEIDRRIEAHLAPLRRDLSCRTSRLRAGRGSRWSRRFFVT